MVSGKANAGRRPAGIVSHPPPFRPVQLATLVDTVPEGRAWAGAPVAAPITWKEMETIDTPAHFHVGDAAELVKRAESKALAGWGRASQALPDL